MTDDLGYLTHEELDAYPLGSFIPSCFGPGRFMRVEGGWQYRETYTFLDGRREVITGPVHDSLDGIKLSDVRRPAQCKITCDKGRFKIGDLRYPDLRAAMRHARFLAGVEL